MMYVGFMDAWRERHIMSLSPPVSVPMGTVARPHRGDENHNCQHDQHTDNDIRTTDWGYHYSASPDLCWRRCSRGSTISIPISAIVARCFSVQYTMYRLPLWAPFVRVRKTGGFASTRTAHFPITDMASDHCPERAYRRYARTSKS